MERVYVAKIELLEGEEIGHLIRKIWAAITRSGEKTKSSMILRGIFKDHVILMDMETAKFFKMQLKREDNGEVELTDKQEVRQVWVPVDQKTAKSEGATVSSVADGIMLVAECGVSDELADVVSDVLKVEDHTAQVVEIEQQKEPSIWAGII